MDDGVETLRLLRQEEQRQSTIFAEAMQRAIDKVGAELDSPMLNAVAGAIVGVEAAMLAAVADPRMRKALRRAMDQSRPRALAEALAKGSPTYRAVPVVMKLDA
ncbi:hypothetical protein [Rhodoplanes serenus]|uniref:hypothetical protein n=1 Tax=Rhodoplanes serenus TaxID=200615 RepID=UPI000DACA30E|nr:hypothetical protein [Rhodoplanes serenus]RAI34771.1 hypothetical protein CH340_07975 [Rhodoplanes serenus]